jgi:hypothetical protein
MPQTVREFAGQVNSVATSVLNEEIDIDQARTYASLARVISQTVSAEVTRARFLKQEPDLTLEAPKSKREET